MNDLVLEGFINSFAEARGLSNIPLDAKFEAFAASSLLRKYHQTDITGMEDDILVGGGGDGGLDAIAILVNGRLVSTDEGLEFFFDSHGRLDVEFVFVQAKASHSFSAADIGNFLFGVEQYFRAVINNDVNVEFKPEIQQKIELTRNIYAQAIRIQDNPHCSLYYVSAGKWTAAPEPKGRLKDGHDRLKSLNLFTRVHIKPVDAESIKAIYRDLERGVVKEVEFIRTAAFPRIKGVGEAYIGLLPGDEFIKLVSTGDGDLNRELFFDNVRDFQGHNPVNREINHTLTDEGVRNSFPLLNNGITIIASSIKRTGDTFQIYDFQIVNGCQTTHILFKNKHVVGPDTYIPLKLVATEDSQVVNEVIKATNRQTAVLPEALESLGNFHRELEDLYNTLESDKSSSERIYYERRSKQYAMDNIRSSNIVTLTGQIKSFIGMFLNEPHSHPRYYGELLKSYEGRIFSNDHRPEPYYTSGVCSLIVEKWLNSRSDWRNLRPYKHQILMLLRTSISGNTVPKINSKEISRYSLKVVETLRDTSRGPEEFDKAIELLKEARDQFFAHGGGRQSETLGNPPHRLRAFTEYLKSVQNFSDQPSVESEGLKVRRFRKRDDRGRIKFFDDVKRYGFIRSKTGLDVFVHASEITAVPYHLRIEGVEVIYKVDENPKTPGMFMASEVRLVPIEEIRKQRPRRVAKRV